MSRKKQKKKSTHSHTHIVICAFTFYLWCKSTWDRLGIIYTTAKFYKQFIYRKYSVSV